MYAVIVFPVVSLTLAAFRLAELGFLGFMMMTCETTPLRCGFCTKSGERTFLVSGLGFLRTAWFSVPNDVAEAWKERWGRRDRMAELLLLLLLLANALGSLDTRREREGAV
jgi:hypothetical protein